MTDGEYSQHPGGKGANQALTARRMGADVSLFARVGADPLADQALHLLRADGVDLAHVIADEQATTGVALIAVAADGENQIVVAPGANRHLRPEDVSVQDYDAVICQLEIPMAVVAEAAAQATGGFFLNAAPVRRVAHDVLARADVVVVNEIEHTAFEDSLAETDALVVVTVGADGAFALQSGREVARALPPPVTVVDTVGAGDTFVGTLAVELTDGTPLDTALAWACAAGALATTSPGAQPAIPRRVDVQRLGPFS